MENIHKTVFIKIDRINGNNVDTIDSPDGDTYLYLKLGLDTDGNIVDQDLCTCRSDQNITEIEDGEERFYFPSIVNLTVEIDKNEFRSKSGTLEEILEY